MLRSIILGILNSSYQWLVKPILFRMSAQQAHHVAIETLRVLDRLPLIEAIFRWLNQFLISQQPTQVGGVALPYPLMLSAGLIKGDGFAGEELSQQAISDDQNIIPGWKSLAALLGNSVELGSFTPHPRTGNQGTVIWRFPETNSTQNRVGLKNPGVVAAAQFLTQCQHISSMGINIAPSPGIESAEIEKTEAIQSVQTFLDCDVKPAWFTLNLSCPNTEDDPTGNQSEAKVYDLCKPLVDLLAPHNIPLWVKIGPDLSDEQYRKLMSAFHDVGVKAVIATNTLGKPTPDGENMAGIGGGDLHDLAVHVVTVLAQEKENHQYDVDVIGCGGVMDAKTYQDFMDAGAKAVQYWSGMVYQGPFLAATILNNIQSSNTQ